MSTFPPYNLTHWFRIVPYDAETSLALNVYGTSGPGNNVNVNLYSQTNDTEQFWRVEIRSNGAFIINRRNQAFALDWYSPNNNCDVYTLAGNETDANIDLLTRSDSYGYYYLIKNVASGKYLTVDNAIATSGANVIWANYKGTGLDGRQRWRFVQDDAYTGSGSSTVSGEITVTNMPSGAGYEGADGKEYFHPDSGMTNGTWAANGGASIENKLREFYRTVYGVYPAGNNTYLHSLFGGRFVSGDYVGCYHPGVDIFRSAGATITSGHTGTVVEKGTYYLTIDIGEGVYVLYLHLAISSDINLGTRVQKGETVLGVESNLSTSAYHLHVEVHTDRNAVPKMPHNDLTRSIGAVPPYAYL